MAGVFRFSLTTHPLNGVGAGPAKIWASAVQIEVVSGRLLRRAFAARRYAEYHRFVHDYTAGAKMIVASLNDAFSRTLQVIREMSICSTDSLVDDCQI